MTICHTRLDLRPRLNMSHIYNIHKMYYQHYSNSIFSSNSPLVEPVKLQLVRAFLPDYCLGALELTHGMVKVLGVCWNDAFHKIYSYNRWESVKVLQYFCGCLDFTHIYDLLRLRFLSTVATKLSFLNVFVSGVAISYYAETS